MMYWDTGDRVVDCLLQKLESYSRWPNDADAEQTHQLLIGLIGIEEMLPEAVSLHFNLPHLKVGSAHFQNGDKYRQQLIEEICTAIKAGLKKAHSDPFIKRDAEPNFSDRPKSRGEAVIEAAENFKEEQTHSNFSQLKAAANSTNLGSHLKITEMLMSRKRPYGNREPAVAMLSELQRQEFDAVGYYSQKL